jgi:hypothetical protein
METVQARAAVETERRRFDFWLGEWDVAVAGAGQAASSVYLDFGDRVIVESFDGRPSSELQAMSVSSYDADAACWRLTWVDSDGRHYAFAGGFQDGEMDLRCERDGELHRVRWFEIAAQALRWRWDRSGDGGRTWTTVREAAYRRVL